MPAKICQDGLALLIDRAFAIVPRQGLDAGARTANRPERNRRPSDQYHDRENRVRQFEPIHRSQSALCRSLGLNRLFPAILVPVGLAAIRKHPVSAGKYPCISMSWAVPRFAGGEASNLVQMPMFFAHIREDHHRVPDRERHLECSPGSMFSRRAAEIEKHGGREVQERFGDLSIRMRGASAHPTIPV
jgi:hypothetical protein